MAKNSVVVTTKSGDKLKTKPDTVEEIQTEVQAETTEPAQETTEQTTTETTTAVVEDPIAETPTETAQEQTGENETTQDTEQSQETAEEVDPWQAKIDDLKTTGTNTERMVVSTMESYTKKMAPGMINSEVEIGQNQVTLWRMIKLVVESEENFTKGFDLVIAYAKQYQDGCFNDRYLFRGMEHIPLDKINAAHFLGMLNVIKLAATSKNKREAMAQVDLNRVMNEQIFSEDARNRVISYFKS